MHELALLCLLSASPFLGSTAAKSRCLVAFQVHTPSDRKFRVVVTKELPGDRWLQMLLQAGCQVDICKHSDTILSQDIIKKLISAEKTHAVLGQLTEVQSYSSLQKATLLLWTYSQSPVLTAAMGWHTV